MTATTRLPEPSDERDDEVAIETAMIAPTPDQRACWERVRHRLRGEVGEAAFNSWLRPVELLDATGRSVRLTVPTRFMRDWVVKNYADRIRTLWQGEDQSCHRVRMRSA